jgi:hypothetical protein
VLLKIDSIQFFKWSIETIKYTLEYMCFSIIYIFVIFILLQSIPTVLFVWVWFVYFVFWGSVSLHSPSWTQIHNLPASTSWVLELQACTTMGYIQHFLFSIILYLIVPLNNFDSMISKREESYNKWLHYFFWTIPLLLTFVLFHMLTNNHPCTHIHQHTFYVFKVEL